MKLIDVESGPNVGGQYIDEVIIKPTLYPKEEHGIEPFKTLIDKFNEKMKLSDTCVVIGYSFRDGNINDTFYDFLKSGKRLIIISDKATLDFSHNFMKNYDMKNITTYTLLDYKVEADSNIMKDLIAKFSTLL